MCIAQMREHALSLAEHANEYEYIRHDGLTFDSLLTWQEGLVSVLFLITSPFRK